jgi:hypothetical protein
MGLVESERGLGLELLDLFPQVLSILGNCCAFLLFLGKVYILGNQRYASALEYCFQNAPTRR